MSTSNAPPGTGWTSARRPSQETSPSGVTRYSNTSSGVARMSLAVAKSRTARVRPPARSRLDGVAERGELVGAESVQVVPGGGEAVRVDGEQVPRPRPGPRDEAGLALDVQVVCRD